MLISEKGRKIVWVTGRKIVYVLIDLKIMGILLVFKAKCRPVVHNLNIGGALF